MNIHERSYQRNKFFLFSILIVAILSSTGMTFQFYLHAGEKRCFSDSAAGNTKILGEYAISDGKGEMPIDLSVIMSTTQKVIFHKPNAARGKFAFIIPFDDEEVTKVREVEMKKRAIEALSRAAKVRHQRTVDQKSAESIHQTRKLLAYNDEKEKQRTNENVHYANGQEANHHDYDFSAHDRPPLTHHEEEEHRKYTKQDDRRRYNDFYDLDDDLDMDHYDGIHDEELEQERILNDQRREEKKGKVENMSDGEKEDEFFTLHKFEVCVENKGERNDYKRRVRLLVNKGEAANDYIRLAKKEHMSRLEASLTRIAEELQDLSHELLASRDREDVLRRRNETTEKRVFLFSMLSLFSLIGVGSYQAMYTKNFFKRKKLL